MGEWGCRVGAPKYREDYQHGETTILDPPPPFEIKDRKMVCFGFRRASSFNFFWWEWRGGGGGGGGRGEEGGGDGNLLLHDLLGGCFLGVGIALLLHFPVFYRVLL